MKDVNYYKEAFLFQYNLICMGFLAVLALFALVASMPVLWAFVLAGLGLELLYVFFAPSFEGFRRWAAGKAREDSQEEYEEEMGERLSKVSNEQQRRFQAVNQLVVDFQERIVRDGTEKLMGNVVQKLLLLRDRYMKMILDQHELETFVSTTDGRNLERQLETITVRLEEKKLHRRIRDNLRQRQAILRKRIAHLGKASNNKDVLGYELETIFDLIQLIRESSMTLADPDNLSRQIDDILIGIESAEEAMEEVSEIGYEGATSEEIDAFAEFDEQLESVAVSEYKH